MRVRFAPSPTGLLHIGGARTALYNWLIARGTEGGQMLLRIEDTDRERSTEENINQILDALNWLGIDWDGEIALQTNAEQRHREVIQQLLDQGLAYRSSATADDVKAYKEQHGHEKGFRGAATASDEGAVRLKVPEGETVVNDLIRGETVFQNIHLDDPVIARADGSPLYNLAVAVDDLDAGITHVVRGEDHLSNTPKQLLVYAALGSQGPIFAHLPLLHGPDGKKLSKRHGAASVQELRDEGYLPAALINYLSLLGWGDPDDETLLTVDELKAKFDVSSVSKNPARFDEKKLRWINGRYLKQLSADDLLAVAKGSISNLGFADSVAGKDDLLGKALLVAQEKAQLVTELWPLISYLFVEPELDEKAAAKWLDDEHKVILTAAREKLAALSQFTLDQIETALNGVLSEQQIKPKDLFQPIRVALTGTSISPGVFETVELAGKDLTLKRLDDALAR